MWASVSSALARRLTVGLGLPSRSADSLCEAPLYELIVTSRAKFFPHALLAREAQNTLLKSVKKAWKNELYKGTREKREEQSSPVTHR